MAESEPITEEIPLEEENRDLNPEGGLELNDKTPECENNNEQEPGIDGEKGGKSTEDEKLEEKDPLMQCITENRGATGENSKLEIDKTISADQMRENILNSGMNLEQQKEELERLDNILANPEQAHIFPDFIKETADTKITYFAALKVDGEGNVRSLIVFVEEIKEKPEEKPIDKIDGVKFEGTTLNLELSIDIDKQEETNKVVAANAETQTQSSAVEVLSDEVVKQEQAIPAILQHEPATPTATPVRTSQEAIIEEIEGNAVQSEMSHVGVMQVVEDRADKVITLEDRIRDLLKDEPENTQPEQTITVATPEIPVKVTVMANEQVEQAQITNENVAQAPVSVEVPPVVVVETTPVEIALTEVVASRTPEAPVAEVAVASEKIEQGKVINEHLVQDPVAVEAPREATVSVETPIVVVETKVVETIGTVVVEKNVAETKEKAPNPNVKKADNTKPEKVILNNDKDIRVANTRESKVVAKEATPEKMQILSTKPNKKVKDNVLPLRARESKPTFKSVEVKTAKPVVEKTVAKNEPEKTSKNNGEAIVLRFNRTTINHTARNEAPISLEKPKDERQITDESVKTKSLNGHEILLQILGLSQNGAEVRNAKPTNSGSFPNINQEEQETKSTKSIPSIYQQRSLNGITLKIAA